MWSFIVDFLKSFKSWFSRNLCAQEVCSELTLLVEFSFHPFGDTFPYNSYMKLDHWHS